MTSTSEHAFLTAWIQTTNTPVDVWTQEHQFDETRKWRFDFAMPEIMLAVEIEGGHAGKSSHKSDAGYRKDLQKYNAAAVQGWLVLRFDTHMVVNEPFDMIVSIVDGINRQWRVFTYDYASGFNGYTEFNERESMIHQLMPILEKRIKELE